jgi:hypothetical protein
VKRYRLPEFLGDGFALDDGPTGPTSPTVHLKVDIGEGDVADVILPRRRIIPVGPDEPDEPPDGTTIKVDNDDERMWILTRDDREVSDDRRWYGAGSAVPFTWTEVCEMAADAPVRMVPDPAVGMELPWVGGGGISVQVVTGMGEDDLAVRLELVGYVRVVSPFTARELAGALLAAADAAEKETP